MPTMLDQAKISSPLREIRFFHHFEEEQEQLFGGLVSAQLDGAVPEPESHHLLDRCGDNC